jgi:restriction system protein
VTAPDVLPSWEGFMVPLLQALSDGKQRTRRETFASAAMMHLGPDQLSQVLKSGQSTADNRAGWAISILTRAEAVARPRRGEYVITDVGRALLAQHPDGLTQKDLEAIPAFQQYVPVSHSLTTAGASAGPLIVAPEVDPIEQIDQGVTRLNADIAVQLLARLREQDPSFLEQAVLDVLVKMGYGGTDGQARRIGGTGDGGVDGVIDQDKLGLQRIYVQAKRYAADNTVGREAIQAFVGALHGRNVSHGIFITTSRFSTGALDYANSIGTRVVLIDGARFADLMINHGVGVQTTTTYTVVHLDEDYFE